MQTKDNTAVFFDLYQTLIDVDIDKERKQTNEVKGWEAFTKSLEQYGAHITPADFLALIDKHKIDFYAWKDRKTYHHNLYTLVLQVFQEDLRIHISKEEVASLLYNYRKIARGYARVYPGVVEVLAECARHYTLAAASYTQGCYTQPELKELGIEKFFSHFVYTSDVGFHKESPKFYTRCLEIVGKRAEDCVMIGDNYDVDVLIPQKLGMKVIWVKNPITAPQYAGLLKQKPEYMIELRDFEKLSEIITEVLTR